MRKTTAMYHACRGNIIKENKKTNLSRQLSGQYLMGSQLLMQMFEEWYYKDKGKKAWMWYIINTERRKYFKNNKKIILGKSCEK